MEYISDLAAQKKLLRKTLKEKRNTLDRNSCISSDTAIFEAIRSWDVYQKAKVIFCFVGTKGEINTKPILEDILKRGKRVGVPKCIAKGIMEVYEIHSLDDLVPGKYDILEPVDTCEKIAPEEIDLALIPCLSCSRDGCRLGYGGGYYDRYLNQVSGTQAVLCRRALMCDEIPMEEHDRVMDFVICEEGVLNIPHKK